MTNQWNKVSIARITLARSKNRITCNACSASEEFMPSDMFATVEKPSLKTGGKTQVKLKTPTEFRPVLHRRAPGPT